MKNLWGTSFASRSSFRTGVIGGRDWAANSGYCPMSELDTGWARLEATTSSRSFCTAEVPEDGVLLVANGEPPNAAPRASVIVLDCELKDVSPSNGASASEWAPSCPCNGRGASVWTPGWPGCELMPLFVSTRALMVVDSSESRLFTSAMSSPLMDISHSEGKGGKALS
jgi:hypothetical protein